LKFEGDFDAKLPIDGLAAPHAQLHVDPGSTHAPSDAIIVPDAHLLFTGDFKRSGVDLILSDVDHELVLRDYFKGEKRAALASPDGAHLTGDIVNALTGHVEYSQADGSASAGKVIGHVTKLSGNATAIRNGVSIILNQGDNVEKGDVVQSGSASTLGITFIDGTVFGLSSNARMVLNEMVYDPNGSNNSSLLSLVAGTISFVAGETAKHGDMKIDTPVATMGIRGTAVLVEIDFDVPQSGGPDAKFQVLVEPDGKTGSYILFDKATLAPIATVNQAGQQVNISHGVVSITNAPLSPDVQKLITDVFSLKFTDNTNVNTKTADHFTDSITPQQFGSLKLPDGTTAVPFILNVNTTINAPPPPTLTLPGSGLQHIDGPPIIFASSDSAGERVAITHSTATDTASGKVNFVDINAGDAPTVKATFNSFTYQNAQHTDVTAKLNAQQLADITAVEVKLAVVPDPGNNNNGSATWTYSVADSAFDFLAAGETLTLTYMARVDNNYAPNDEASFQSFTITVTGTNDVPVITTGPESVAYSGGKTTPGGNLKTVGNAPTTGTLAFTDVDLTDTHTVSTALTGASMSGPGAVTLDMAALDALAPTPMAAFEKALSAMVASDSTGAGSGTINWQLADLPVYLADFIPKGEKLTLTYTVTVTDSQNTTSTQTVTVTITGTAAAAVVWIATTGSGSTGDWNDPANWETGTVPTANDDTIIITDQLQHLTPYYPVTINAPAFAKTVTMNDFGSTAPELDNNSSLTIGGTFDLITDAIVNNNSTHSISVGGAMEVLNKSHLVNAGTLTLAQGGDFKDQSSIANSGTLDVKGGTLNVLVNVANTGGTVQVAAAALALNGAAIDGGTVTNKANGTIDLTGAAVLKNGTLSNSGQINVSGAGNALDGETVTNTGAGAIDVTGTLDLENATVNGGKLGGSGTIATASGNSDSTLNGVTVASGTTVTAAVGTLDLTGIITNNGEIDASTGTLDLKNATINGGTLGGHGSIATATGNSDSTLNGVTIAGATTVTAAVGTLDLTGIITNNGEIDAGTGTLDLENATVNGGTLGGHGTIATATGNSDSTLNGVTIAGATTVTAAVGTLDLTGIITNNGEIDAASTGTLDLENATVNGGTLGGHGSIATATGNNDSTLNGVTIAGGTTVTAAVGTLDLTGIITNNGEIDAGTGTLDLENATVNGGTLGGHGTIATATGNSDSTLNGVTIAGGTTVTAAVGTLDLTGIITNNGEIDATTGTLDLENATVNGGKLGGHGTIATASGNSASTLNGVTVNSGTTVTAAVGTLDLTGIITNNGEIDAASTGTLDLENDTVNGGTLGGHGTIATATGNSDSTLNGVTIAGGTTVTAAVGTLDLTGIITNNGEIDASTGTLDLENATVNGGTINDHGLIDVTGSSSINGTINGGVITNAVLNSGGVTVASGVTLTLDNVTVNGTAFKDNATGAALSVESGDTLTLQNDASVTGGKLNNAGTVQIETTSGATLDGVSVVNTGGIINVDTIQSPSLVTLTLQDSTTITNGTLSIGNIGRVEVASVATATLDGVTVHNGSGADPDGLIQVDANAFLDFEAATITGGVLSNSGTVTSSGASALTGVMTTNNSGDLLEVTSGELTVTNGSVSNAGTIEVVAGALDLDSVTVTKTSVTAAVQVDANAFLDLEAATISGGTLNISGELDSSGTSFITGATIINASHIKIVSGTLTIDPAPVTNTGQIQVTNDSTLVLSGETIANSVTNADGSTTKGTIEVDATDRTHFSTLDLDDSAISGGTLTISGVLDSIGTSSIKGATINNTGTIDVTSGTLTIDATSALNNTGKLETNGGNLIIDTAFSGNLEIKGGAVLELGASSPTAYSSVVVTFDPKSTGTLKLDYAEVIHGRDPGLTVTGLDDNTLDLGNIVYGADLSVKYVGTFAGGTLSVFKNGVDVSDVHLTGNYLGVHWNLADDGTHGTNLSEIPGAIAGLDSNGNATEGSAISASVTDGGLGVTNTQYQWQIFDAGTGQWVDGSGTGVNSANYIPSEQDEGHALRVSLSFTDALLNTDHTTVSAGIVTDITLAFTSAASISGTAQEGTVLTAVNGTLNDSDASVTGYQWQISANGTSGWSNIVGATNSTYTPIATDETKFLHVVETATDSDGGPSTTSISAATLAVTDITLAFASAASISGTAQEGHVLTAVNGTLNDGDAAVTGYQWTRDGAAISGATAATYTVTEADESHVLRVVETATDKDGGPTTASTSNPTAAVATDLVAALDSTTAKQNVAIHVTGVKDGGNTVTSGLSYTWEVSSDNGQDWTTVGTNANTYTPAAIDDCNLLQVVVTYADAGENESTTDSLGIVASSAKYWNGGSHDWQSGGHWTPSGVPSSSDDAVVAVSGTVSVGDDSAAHSLTVNDVGATAEVQGGNTLTLGGNLTIAAGTFLIDSGGTLKDTATSATISGTFTDNGTVEAAGGTLEIASTVISGAGAFKIDAGATLKLDHSATISGTLTDNGTLQAAGGTLEIKNAVISGAGAFKIDAGATLQLDHADALNVAFAGSGKLILLDPAHFTGQIAGITGSGDVLDLDGFSATTTTAKTGNGSYDSSTNITTLTVKDSPHHLTETFKLTGDLSNSSWTVTDDHNGGVSIVDPPAPTSPDLGPVVMHDPGPAASNTIVASVPNETLIGGNASNAFVFNFAGVGHDTVSNFHTDADTLQFSAPLFANAQAALNATHDDGHGNTVVTLDAQDTITLAGILKAQLHATDFHFV
jgi:hypothetical protein